MRSFYKMNMKPFVHEIDADPLDVFSRVQHLPYSLFLDSADRAHSASRYSFIVCNPVEKIEVNNGRVSIVNMNQITTLDGDVFSILNERCKVWSHLTETIPDLPPFQGGLAGFFGYDLVRGLENLPYIAQENLSMPDMAIGVYDQVISFDHQTGKAWIITHARSEAEAKGKRLFLQNVIEKGKAHKSKPLPPISWKPQFKAEQYKSHINKVIEYIRAGDIFQANLAQRFDANLPEGFDAYSHYLQLRESNPAPFATFMNLGPVKISSASPERFLTVQNDRIETRPIKGTRPRGTNDTAMLQELENSAKDRAENIMIVDLLRNDLSKVCETESINVSALCRIETFASVHHLVSVIEGKLRKGKTALDALRACFPGGSITGAPKIRSMEIIEELEPTQRGPYCGAMGYIGFDGSMDTNILIRTLVYDRNRVLLQAGGGITADSDAESEYQETLAKADAMFRSFAAEKKAKAA